MDQNDKARVLEKPAELTHDEVGLLHSQVAGHRWSGWCRLTADEGYYAACSCGWRTTVTGDMSTMLHQVKDHLDVVERSRGWCPSALDESGTGASRGEIQHLYERARGLRTTARDQQSRLSRSLGHSTELLSASAEQADLLVTEMERGQPVRTGTSRSGAEIVREKVQRARELRKAIVAAAAALAVIAEEIAEFRPGTGHEKAVDWIYGERLIEPAEATPPSGK